MSLTEELLNWVSEQKCQKAVAALGKKGFTAIFCREKQAAYDYIIREASDANTVGLGGSLTVASLNVAEKLKELGKELFNHNMPGLSPEEKLATLRRQPTCDLYLTGTNAITLTGSLVNIDGLGNRVGSMGFGPKKVIVVVGRNKVVADTEDALKRIKTYAAPPNAKRLNYNTPCAKTGFCTDCDSPERICRITTIIEYKPRLTDIRVLVINEDMGL
ncbi:MAG TPA: lactate utilization protein [Desulfosporosinus sp.]